MHAHLFSVLRENRLPWLAIHNDTRCITLCQFVYLSIKETTIGDGYIDICPCFAICLYDIQMGINIILWNSQYNYYLYHFVIKLLCITYHPCLETYKMLILYFQYMIKEYYQL